MRKQLLWFLVALTMVVLAGCGGSTPSAGDSQDATPQGKQEAPKTDDKGGAAPQPAAEKKVIKFADTQFQTLWINNAIAGFIIEKGYGYPVETVEMTTPIYQKTLESGEIDVMMELWRANLLDWYTKATQSGKVIDLGDVYEKSTQGWYVPRYVIEGDEKRGIKASAPDLKSVSDLPKYKQVFQDPENPDKGLLVNCITGWQCAKINRIKLHAYGLDKDYNLQEPGAAAALDAAIAGAYKRGKPVLAYYWEPTWLLGTYDMVQLQEPKFTKACDDQIQKLLQEKSTDYSKVPREAGCAYETQGIHKGVNASLQKRAPEVVEFLRKMNVGTDPLNKTAAYMKSEDVEADKAAIWFLQNHKDRWTTWVPPDVAAKVEAAITG